MEQMIQRIFDFFLFGGKDFALFVISMIPFIELLHPFGCGDGHPLASRLCRLFYWQPSARPFFDTACPADFCLAENHSIAVWTDPPGRKPADEQIR